MPALLAAVDAARYRQESDEVGDALADDEVAVLLRPVAEAVAAAPASVWWTQGVAPADRHAVT